MLVFSSIIIGLFLIVAAIVALNIPQKPVEEKVKKPDSNFDNIYIFIPGEPKQIIRISEGTGDNLLDEDIDEGYVDYIYYDVYAMDDCDIRESDGGQIMLSELFRKKYSCTEDCIPDVLDMAYGKTDIPYIVLK